MAENREETGSESDSGIMRKVQLKRHCNLHQSSLHPSPATKKCATHLEVGYILTLCSEWALLES